MIKTTLAKLLTTKLAIAAAATAAVTVGGVATVAATGHLPGSGGHSTDTPASSSASAKPADESSHGKPETTGAGAEPNGSPSPSLVGLCHAYTAGAGSDHGKALESPAFTYLITTAGGKDKVDAYCANVLAAKENPPATTPPAAAEHTTPTHPSQAQDDNTHKNEPTKPSH